jgi:putative membrane protein
MTHCRLNGGLSLPANHPMFTLLCVCASSQNLSIMPSQPSKLKSFLQRWLINTVAVLVATYIVPRIHYQGWLDLVVATFVLGILNTFLRPLLLLLSLPLVVVTLGLFTLVINALLVYFVGWLLKPAFTVETFGAAFWGALIITLVSLVLNSLTGSGDSRIEFRRGKPRPPSQKPDDDDGPVIDV